MTDLVNASADEVKRANYGNKLEQWRAMQESGCHVATSQRCDVSTSRRFHVATFPTSRRWVNQYRSQQFKTSRRLNVATSQRRDVSTSRRCNIATSQRRDVSSRSAPHHLKYEWLRNQGIGRRTNEGTEFQSRVTQTSTKCPGFVLFLIFVGYWNDVFNIKHCDFLI